MDICASFQKSIVEILSEKTKKAFKIFQKNFPEAKFSFSISGGVAANLEIRKSQENISKLHKTNFFAPIEVSGKNSKPIIAGTSGAKKPIRKGHKRDDCLSDTILTAPRVLLI